MEPSQRLWDYLKSKEAFRQYPYQDEAEHWTIGYGHKLLPAEIKILTKVNTREAEEIMRRDVAPIAKVIEAYTQNIALNQNQFDALVSLVYNIGARSFKQSKIRRLLTDGLWGNSAERCELIAREIHRWNKITISGVQRVSNGLVRRRLEESEWFVEPVKYANGPAINVHPLTPELEAEIQRGIERGD